MGCNTQRNFERSVKNTFNVQGRGVYLEEVHLYGKVECMSTNIQNKEVSFRGGVQSKKFHFTSNKQRHKHNNLVTMWRAKLKRAHVFVDYLTRYIGPPNCTCVHY